jgi:hypothetical protein
MKQKYLKTKQIESGDNCSDPDSSASSTDLNSSFLESNDGSVYEESPDNYASPGDDVDIDALDLAFHYPCNIKYELSDDGGALGDDSSAVMERLTVDSLVLSRRRLAKNRLEAYQLQQEKKKERQLGRSLSDTGPNVSGGTLARVRERLSYFVDDAQRRRGMIRKHDSLELTKAHHPNMIHVYHDMGNRRWRMLSRARDSLELTRKRLPHLIVARSVGRSRRLVDARDSLELARKRLPHLILSREDDDQEETCSWVSDSDSLSDDESEWDSDFDPFADEVDSLVLARRRLPSRLKAGQTTEAQEQTSEAQEKIHTSFGKSSSFDRKGLDEALLQLGPNSWGANCAA